jgi:DNA-binding response OmpR family regulator
MRVLVIEDNPDIVANLHQYLEPLGYELDSARTGKAGLDSFGITRTTSSCWT